MGLPVKISDKLVEAAREVAAKANRSVTKQIEHWAEIGRAVEHLAALPDIVAIKSHLDDPSDAQDAEARAALERLVGALADYSDRSSAQKLIFTGKPVYGAVPGRADRVMQVWPDGRRVAGRFVGDEFVVDGLVSPDVEAEKRPPIVHSDS